MLLRFPNCCRFHSSLPCFLGILLSRVSLIVNCQLLQNYFASYNILYYCYFLTRRKTQNILNKAVSSLYIAKTSFYSNGSDSPHHCQFRLIIVARWRPCASILRPTWVCAPNQILVCSAVFARLTSVTKTHIDHHAKCDICSVSSHLPHCLRCRLIVHKAGLLQFKVIICYTKIIH